jgi:hypothetical protein
MRVVTSVGEYRSVFQRETASKRDVIEALDELKQEQAVWDYTPAASKYTRPGVADRLVVVRGRAFAIESKSAFGAPTLRQLADLRDFALAGGTSILYFGGARAALSDLLRTNSYPNCVIELGYTRHEVHTDPAAFFSERAKEK